MPVTLQNETGKQRFFFFNGFFFKGVGGRGDINCKNSIKANITRVNKINRDEGIPVAKKQH